MRHWPHTHIPPLEDVFRAIVSRSLFILFGENRSQTSFVYLEAAVERRDSWDGWGNRHSARPQPLDGVFRVVLSIAVLVSYTRRKSFCVSLEAVESQLRQQARKSHT